MSITAKSTMAINFNHIKIVQQMRNAFIVEEENGWMTRYVKENSWNPNEKKTKGKNQNKKNEKKTNGQKMNNEKKKNGKLVGIAKSTEPQYVQQVKSLPKCTVDVINMQPDEIDKAIEDLCHNQMECKFSIFQCAFCLC